MRSVIRGILCFLFLSAMNANAAESSREGRLVLPPVVHAVPGIEANLYFDNIVLAPPGRALLFDVTCARGQQQEERWTFTPAEGDVGEFPLSVTVRDLDDRVVATAQTTVRVAAGNAGAGGSLTLLCIGDSLTHASVYTAELLKLFGTSGNPSLRLLGTHHVKDTAEGNVHEGYGGWKYQDFVTKYEPNPEPGSHAKRSSPFVFADDKGPVFDFGRYVKEQLGGTPPDFVTIFLGPNDVFGSTDENLEETITRVMGYADKLLAGIRAAAPRAKIGLLPPVPPTASQDGFGANYGCSQTRWQYRKNQHRLVEAMLARYSGREADGVCVVPAYASFDSVHNYPVDPGSRLHARSTETIPRVTNALHPALSGYRQIADSIYCWIKGACSVQSKTRSQKNGGTPRVA